MGRASAVVALLLSLGLTGCAQAVAGPRPTTTAVPTTVAAPRRVVLIGDSTMSELAPAVEAATAGRAQAGYVLTIGAANVNASWWTTWAPLIAEQRPDAVVVLVGLWDTARPGLGTYEWARWYAARLDAWADLLTAGGAHLYWVAPMPVRDPAAEASLRIVTDAYAALAHRRGDVTLIVSGSVLGSPSGGYLERDASGQRLRRVDGTHLCPAGAVLLAARLVQLMGIDAPPGWQHGPWTSTAPAYSPVECPT